MKIQEIFAPTAEARKDVLTILNSENTEFKTAFGMGNGGLYLSNITELSDEQLSRLTALKQKHIGNFSFTCCIS